MKPALSAEEWAAWGRELDLTQAADALWVRLPTSFGPHGIAAAMLHEQEFGFTREDVEHHRRYAQVKRDSLKLRSILGPRAPGFPPSEEATAKLEEMADWHENMADRLEALLPPEAE